MDDNMKQEVLEANLLLKEWGLVIFTWGNVSAIDRRSGQVVIKPSGVPYETMKVEDLVVVDLDGNTVEGRYKPSSDLATHLELYEQFADCGAVVHTHSRLRASVLVAIHAASMPLPIVHINAHTTSWVTTPAKRNCIKGEDVSRGGGKES